MSGRRLQGLESLLPLVGAVAFALLMPAQASWLEALKAPTAAAAPAALSAKVALPSIAVQPLGPVPAPIVQAVLRGLEAVYSATAQVWPEKSLPESAWYPPRQRWRADRLLDYLETLPRGQALRVVGLTEKDISTTKAPYSDWGVFGLGTLGGPTCVVSTFRLKRQVSEATFVARLVKVVNHELGHTFGLDHCPTPGCLMQDAGGTVKTVDQESGAFCSTCKARLAPVLKVGP